MRVKCEINECGARFYADTKKKVGRRWKERSGEERDLVDYKGKYNQAKGRNFSIMSSMIGDFSRTCAIEGGRLRFMLPE